LAIFLKYCQKERNAMYKQILCPVDGSTTSNTGMNEAILLAKDQQAKLRFLHVIDTFFPILDISGDLNAVYLADILRENGKNILKKAEEAAKNAGVTADSIMIDAMGSRVSKSVLSQAEEWHADLIVMGTHGLRGFERFMIGSDAQAILHTSPVPVLLVRNNHR
jgi:nucleotide-binding universal stress UspA family protein